MTFEISKEDFELLKDMLIRQLIDMQESGVDREILARHVQAYNHLTYQF